MLYFLRINSYVFYMQDKDKSKISIRRDTLIMYLKNSSENIELEDILYWLSRYTGVEIKQENK